MYTHVSGEISPPGLHSSNTGQTPHGTDVSADFSGMGHAAGV